MPAAPLMAFLALLDASALPARPTDATGHSVAGSAVTRAVKRGQARGTSSAGERPAGWDTAKCVGICPRKAENLCWDCQNGTITTAGRLQPWMACGSTRTRSELERGSVRHRDCYTTPSGIVMVAALGMRLFAAAPSCERGDALAIASLVRRCDRVASCQACSGAGLLRHGEEVILSGLNSSHGLAGRRDTPIYRYLSLFSCTSSDDVSREISEYGRGGGTVLALSSSDGVRFARPFTIMGASSAGETPGDGALVSTLAESSLRTVELVYMPWLPGVDGMTHNLAGPVHVGEGHTVMMGGVGAFYTSAQRELVTFKRLRKKQRNPIVPSRTAGIFLTSGPGYTFDPTTWARPSLAISAAHAGCVDQRLRTGYGFPFGGGCQYDGRLSLVQHQDTFLLYARANLRECSPRGGRFVTVARSPDLSTWGPMEPISIEGYDEHTGDIYFFAVQTNPLDERKLLALFPLSLPPRGCIAMSMSNDGVHWSPSIKLVDSTAVLGTGRTQDHPIAGGVRLRNGTVYFYVQKMVPGIGAPIGSRRTRIVRYSLPAAELSRLTQMALPTD
ncbi:hypothetical protein AB1Y20_000833 [Prymnesium parvum]|uniref:Sialidase domain-containing protein n=1 Tax=Prymnesium parvum TaxID=97485 RepID=A0AB34K6K0_PRYPA